MQQYFAYGSTTLLLFSLQLAIKSLKKKIFLPLHATRKEKGKREKREEREKRKRKKERKKGRKKEKEEKRKKKGTKRGNK